MPGNIIHISSARARIAGRANEGPRAIVREFGVAWRAGNSTKAMWLYQTGVETFCSAAIISAFKEQALERIDAALPPYPNGTILEHRERLIVSVQSELEQMGARNAAERARRYVEEYHRA
jgi:hypothetical protein